MRTLINASITIAYLLFVQACSPSNLDLPKISGAKATQCPPGSSLSGSECLPSKEKKKEEPYSADAESAVPDYQSAALGDKFGRQVPDIKRKKKAPEDKEKLFLVQKIDAYRPVFLNLTKPNDAFMWKVVDKFLWSRDVDDKENPVWERNEAETISVHQPLPEAATHDYERGDKFKIFGHTLSLTLGWPRHKTAVISEYLDAGDNCSPQNQQPPAICTVIAPPKKYTRVYHKDGPMTEEVFEACKRQGEAAVAGAFPAAEDTMICATVAAGSEQMFDSQTMMYGGSNFNLQDFYQKQTLVIWRAEPYPGYACLGDIATNTTESPLFSTDASGIPGQQSDLMANNCINKQYLLPGKLVEILSRDDIAFYEIEPENPNEGFADANFFYAINIEGMSASAKKKAEEEAKVWVLNRKYANILPSMSLPKRP
ncbi:MAG: hypothetical protein HYW48_04485 [Deltaproteobacteria bacterium]|nr:hypothetical protein [Deltaproteobacteria bacterium]